ncbi:Zinc finger protein, partial [Pseudolycoriella hygida]
IKTYEKMTTALTTDGLEMSAIIYRDKSASFICVCYHCGRMFNEIDESLQHIESHFQLTKIEVYHSNDNDKDENSVECCTIPETTDIKIEILDKFCGKDEKELKQMDEHNEKEVHLEESRSRNKRDVARPYRCHKCAKGFKYINLLKTHLATHPEDDLLKVYKCKECDCYYESSLALRLHVLQVHLMVKDYTCNACWQQFPLTLAKQFEEHLRGHNGPKKKLWSELSDGIYHQEVDLTKYEETDSVTEDRFQCEFCTQKFYLKSNLEAHTKSVHSGQRRLQCGQCESVFTAPKYYFAHQLEHQRVGRNILERDDNVLLARLDACIDERIICDEDEFSKQLYRCLICNAAFDVQYDLRSHIRERHVYKMFPQPTEPKKEFICDMCGVRLKTKSAVKNHLLIHTNTKSHACTICGKKFRQNSDRRIHERQHTGEKPFQCHECGKAFISKGLLTAHKKSHEDTTYPCHICGREFNLPSGYRKHIQTHRQDRSFKCTICPKSFNTRIYLTKHMSIHSNKQYQCRFCDCKFSTGDGQRQHQRNKHKYTSL